MWAATRRLARLVVQALMVVVTPLGALGAPACDEVEESLQGKAAPLKEPDLPNCSRVLTCCANLSADSILGPLVADTCDTIVTPTDLTISNYQAAKLRIEQNGATSAETKSELLSELRTTTQAAVEPACRCLVEETVGNLSLDGLLSPKDCEVVTGSGTLPPGKQCSDVTDVVLDPAE